MRRETASITAGRTLLRRVTRGGFWALWPLGCQEHCCYSKKLPRCSLLIPQLASLLVKVHPASETDYRPTLARAAA